MTLENETGDFITVVDIPTLLLFSSRTMWRRKSLSLHDRQVRQQEKHEDIEVRRTGLDNLNTMHQGLVRLVFVSHFKLFPFDRS